MAASSELSGELEIGVRESNEAYIYKKPTGPLADWLKTLNLSTSEIEATEDVRAGRKELKDWAFFPVEALFGSPPALYKRLFDDGVPGWAQQDDSRHLPIKDIDATSGGTPGRDDRLGLIGQQVFRLLNQKSADRCEFELTLQSRQDLKIIKIFISGPSESLDSPPPFAYTGRWSDEPKDHQNINLTAVAALWHHAAYRERALDWLKGKGDSFFLGYPPLAHFELVFDGVAERAIVGAQPVWKLSLKIRIRLPHFFKNSGENDKRVKVVSAIPSLLVLESPLRAPWKNWKDLRKEQETAPAANCESPKPEDLLECLFADSEPPKPKTLLVASPHLRAAVEKMSELWADHSLRNVLLIAPPGSGKEVLAEFLHAGSVFFGQEKSIGRVVADVKLKNVDGNEFSEWERVATRIAEVSLAGTKDISTVQRIVFGQVQQLPDKDRAKVDRAVPIGRRTDLYWVGGLVLDARGTTVFLDEIDKAEPEIRSALLRFLENDEIYPEKSPRPLRLDQLEKLFEDSEKRRLKTRLLFAGSKPRKEILGSSPPDFWTRMHRIIEIPHPFEIPDADERTRCIQEYVILFLYRGVQNKFKGKAKAEKAKGAARGPYETLDDLLEHILNGNSSEESDLGSILSKVRSSGGYPFFYLDSERITNISRFVASFLVRFSPSALSVRNLRSIIKQLDYRIELWVDQGIDLLATQDPGGTFSSEEGSQKSKERHFDRAWIWGNLHDISLSLLR
ncbi:MAG TPA: hypothetical protein VN493_18220 [Thermoanaerobaculia bacterium]|nr:hypothetical protein [Thermoanaerobaculia bacterium]